MKRSLYLGMPWPWWAGLALFATWGLTIGSGVRNGDVNAWWRCALALSAIAMFTWGGILRRRWARDPQPPT